MDNKILESILEKLTRMDDRLSSLEDRLSIKNTTSTHDITIVVYAETATAIDKDKRDIVITSYATELITKHSSPVINAGYIIKPLDQLYSAHPAVVSCDALWQVLNGLALVASANERLLILINKDVELAFGGTESWLPKDINVLVNKRVKTIREAIVESNRHWDLMDLNTSGQSHRVKEKAQRTLDRLLEEYNNANG